MSARSFAQLLSGGYGQRKTKGNADAPTDRVRAHSIDVDHPKAKPGRAIGDGSPGHAWAFRKAQVSTLKRQYERQRKEGYKGAFRIQATFLHIYEVMLAEFLFVKNGDFFPSYEAIAEISGESPSTVKRMVLVLEYWGYICHVRRSRKVEQREGLPGWQREPASNAYYFDCKARMPQDLWRDFWRSLMGCLKSLTKVAARAAHIVTLCFNSAARPAPREPQTELRINVARLGESLARSEQQALARASASRPPDRISRVA